MRRFRKRLPADDVDLVLLAHRIGIAADARRTQQGGADLPESGHPTVTFVASTVSPSSGPVKQDPVHADGGSTAFAAVAPAPMISVGNADAELVEDM